MHPLVAEISGRRVGIELEVAIPIVGRGQTRDIQDLLARILTSHGVSSHARPYSHLPIPDGYDLSVEYDGSLSGEQRYAGISWAQIEIKTRPMAYTEIQRVLPPALEIVRYVGARVTTTCGFHVHHDCPEVAERPQVVRNLAHLWWRYHKVIYGLVAPSRKQNSYCRPPEQNEATRFDNCRTFGQLCRQLRGCERHSGLNLTNLADRRRRTVEWRLHGGTTDWSKISAWALATQRWVEHAAQRSCQYRPEPVANTQSGLNALLLTTGLRPNSRIYSKVAKELREVGKFLLRRWKRFNEDS